MKEEVERRMPIDGIDPMSWPKAWPLQCLNDWLMAHSLIREDDITLKALTAACIMATGPNNSSTGAGKYFGTVAILDDC